jgi:hypothetical protein
LGLARRDVIALIDPSVFVHAGLLGRLLQPLIKRRGYGDVDDNILLVPPRRGVEESHEPRCKAANLLGFFVIGKGRLGLKTAAIGDDEMVDDFSSRQAFRLHVSHFGLHRVACGASGLRHVISAQNRRVGRLHYVRGWALKRCQGGDRGKKTKGDGKYGYCSMVHEDSPPTARLSGRI